MKETPQNFIRVPSRVEIIVWTVVLLIFVGVPWWVGILHMLGVSSW